MVKRVAIAGVIAIGVAVAWWLTRGDPSTAGDRQGLPMDETVELRWVDEETGEEDVWKVTKKDTAPEDREVAPALPEPDLDAGTHVPDESARGLLAMGLESWKRGDIRDAMTHLEDAIEADPDDPLPRTQYGRLKVLAMDYRQALPHLERAAELRPDDPQVWLDLATLYGKAGPGSLDRAWEARRRAEELVGEESIHQDEKSGFWVVEGTSIYP